MELLSNFFFYFLGFNVGSLFPVNIFGTSLFGLLHDQFQEIKVEIDTKAHICLAAYLSMINEPVIYSNL